MSATTIDKDWAKEPVPVGKRWVRKYAASTLQRWATGRESLHEAVQACDPSKYNRLLSVAAYETRVTMTGRDGIYFNGYVAQLDDEDHDITRNLETLS